MEELKFTKEEKKELQKTMNILLEDLRELSDCSQTEEIIIDMYRYIPNERWNLIIDDKKISLRARITGEEKVLHRKQALGKNQRHIAPEISFNFIKNYESIRQAVEYKVKSGIKIKDAGFETLKKMNQKYDKEAAIEIDLPPTNNQYPLEVTEENGQKIGTLNFGERTIKIITNGAIVLVDKTNAKVKEKNRR